ncbi:Uma2 family endonuclease [Capnocytophaga sp.]|uniref:Uma2 family endonuclease n=1 Tax=Capnocytophaga sp. TaxID=44737 RepID=UPI0026DD540E|nr:Uma2 family endonuclease [Capnocytophaga sp.]MDO5105540.1 Uma2 family endonuclease [Capnocytophaga sp.]
MEITNLSQLDPNGTYTYADYLLWKFKERVELFKGKIFAMSPAPARVHQEVLRNLYDTFSRVFRGQKCKLYFAPFDVRLPQKNGEVVTVVQPDLCVICDLSKLDEKGCQGAPDLVVEIVSPGNSKREMKNKLNLYEEAGVQEYWVVHPSEKAIFIYVLEAGKYRPLKPIFEGEIFASVLFPELKVDADQVFEM